MSGFIYLKIFLHFSNAFWVFLPCGWERAVIVQLCAFCLTNPDVLVWWNFSPSGICPPSYYLILIISNPPPLLWGILSGEEAHGIPSMRWWQDWATQVGTTAQIFSCDRTVKCLTCLWAWNKPDQPMSCDCLQLIFSNTQESINSLKYKSYRFQSNCISVHHVILEYR